jgi:hypothetical protein
VVFNIYLPHAEETSAAAATIEEKLMQGGTERILYVDDYQPLVDLAVENLTNLGYRVTTLEIAGKP